MPKKMIKIPGWLNKKDRKKNRKIGSLIKKMIDLEAKLGNEVAELE